MACAIYRLAHGHSLKHMADRFKVEASIIKKYIDIVYDIITDREKLFNHYIAIPSKDHLQGIINDFEELIGLSNICGAIDGTHVSLAKHPSKKITLAASNFYNRKKFYSIVLQGVCNSKRFFGMFV